MRLVFVLCADLRLETIQTEIARGLVPSRPNPGATVSRLLAKVEFFENDLVTVSRRVLEIIKKAAALGDHLQETAAGGVILDVRLEMLGELVDSVCKQGDLHVGTAGVFDVHLEALDI